MKSVIFGFSKPVKSTLLSNLISKVECRAFSHAYIRFNEPTTQIDMVFQASGLSLNILAFEEFAKHSLPVEEYELPVSAEEFLEFWTYVLHSLGKPYSLTQLVLILGKKLFGLQSGNNGDSAQICSEAAARVAKLLRLPVTGNIDYITPSDFNKICQQHLQRVL